MDRTENTVPHGCSSVVAMGTCLFVISLFNNGCCIFSHLAVIGQQRIYMLHSILLVIGALYCTIIGNKRNGQLAIVHLNNSLEEQRIYYTTLRSRAGVLIFFEGGGPSFGSPIHPPFTRLVLCAHPLETETLRTV
jgi:hypothetical protein